MYIPEPNTRWHEYEIKKKPALARGAAAATRYVHRSREGSSPGRSSFALASIASQSGKMEKEEMARGSANMTALPALPVRAAVGTSKHAELEISNKRCMSSQVAQVLSPSPGSVRQRGTVTELMYT